MKIVVNTLINNPRYAAILLLVCTLVSLFWANSPWAISYQSLHQLQLGLHFGSWSFAKSLDFWVNDGLMAVFFLLVGLEIKREMLIGHLNSPRKAALPVIAAIGGMAVPALLFILMNLGHPGNLAGWGVPMATDIAFAMCLLGLLDRRIPRGLLVLLTAIAIVDDLGAVSVIAIFYNNGIHFKYLLLALAILVLLYAANRAKFKGLWLYIVLGLALWMALLHSGVHATIAGVLLAFMIPIEAGNRSPLQRLEHFLKLPVMFGIIPLFILLNAGVSISMPMLDAAWHSPITWGIIGGLLLGKVLGIFGLSSIFIKLDWLHLPEKVSLRLLLPMSIIAGIGFTMALFIAELAYPGSQNLVFAKVGILSASLIAAGVGYAMMWIFTRV
ncbi:MAG: Na+/H+ antiporter NhaA [Gammaproteobacteria bacterium]|nr:Na+/H+ antiporter NhaA [Gammaproteobacteria bacterium]